VKKYCCIHTFSRRYCCARHLAATLELLRRLRAHDHDTARKMSLLLFYAPYWLEPPPRDRASSRHTHPASGTGNRGTAGTALHDCTALHTVIKDCDRLIASPSPARLVYNLLGQPKPSQSPSSHPFHTYIAAPPPPLHSICTCTLHTYIGITLASPFLANCPVSLSVPVLPHRLQVQVVVVVA
jgi:hypothetical protein